MKHIIIGGILFFTTIVPGISQKVKYKDLFILLSAENYTDGDRYLRAFLKEEPDHPHANYYMGRMLQSYMEEEDLLTSSDRIIGLADSSVQYLNKALNLTTEKYIKKRDQYYAEFQRRDMRTAKFTIKLSDVHLDMEARMQKVKDYKSTVTRLFIHFNTAVNYYDSSLHYYTVITSKAGSTNTLYFNSGPEDFLEFRKLAECYDSTLYNFNSFQNLIKNIDKKGDGQKLVVKPIDSYPLTNIAKPDFYASTVEFWDFQEWATSTEDVILKQIYPLKKRMLNFDEKLGELYDRIIKDSLDARPEVFRLATENVARDIVDYDKLSLPAAIFDFRIAEINYHSAVNYWYKVVADTMHVGLKLDVLTVMRTQQRGNIILLTRLKGANNEVERIIFKEFITARYQDDTGIEAYIDSQIKDVENDSLLLDTWFAEAAEQDKFAYWHDARIALLAGEQTNNEESNKYSTFMIEEKSERGLAFYAWMEDESSLSLSFGIAPSSRSLDTLYSVQINPVITAGQDLHYLQFLSDSIADNERIWVLNSPEPAEDSAYKIQVINTQLTRGIDWNNEFTVSGVPKSIKFDEAAQSITLFSSNEEVLIVLTKDGEEILDSDSSGNEQQEY